MFFAGAHPGAYVRGRPAAKAATYYRSYSRALLNYASNGFFSRDLDADDFAFIERIREHGTVLSGSLAQLEPTPCTYSDDVVARVALIEEMDFWVDHKAARATRVGPVPRVKQTPVGTTPAAIERRLRVEQLAATRAEVEAEELRKRDERRIEQLRRDIEWERAGPRRVRRKFGRVEGRHYVPQWKADEIDAVATRNAAKQNRIMRLQEIRARRAAEKREQALAIARREESERHRHERALRMAKNESRRQAMEVFKERIIAAMRQTYPSVMTLDALMPMTGCNDKDFFVACAEELVKEGKMRVNKAP